MKTLLLLLFCHVSSPVKHSVTLLATGSSGVPNMPDFMMTAKFEDIQVYYCDSNKARRTNPNFWEKVNNVDPQIYKWSNERCSETLPMVYSVDINFLKAINPYKAVHIFQCMGGCDWDDKTGDVSSFLLCGYNGDDFTELALQNATWITQHPVGLKIKLKWDVNQAFEIYYKHIVTQKCPEWLKKLVAIDPLKRTGFYPSRALMFWRKDGEEIHEDVEHGDILPNHDETFQMRVDLNVSSIPPGDWRRYDCVFQLSEEENIITTKLEKHQIRTNWVSPSDFPSGAVIGCSVGLLLVTCITGFFIWKKKYHGFRPANTSD